MVLRGQSALVTGASSGIGNAIALALAREGVNLSVVGRSRDRLVQSLAAACTSHVSISIYEADLSDAEEIAALTRRIVDETGRLDILVHSAACISLGALETASPEDFDLQYRLNLRAPFVLTRALLPFLKASQGQVVFINSTAGLKANAKASLYSATKHGLKALADSLRDETGPDGVRVMSIFSGRTNTPMQRGIIDWEDRPWRPECLLQPEDVAAVLLGALSLPRTAEVTDLSVRPRRRYPD